MGGFSAGSVIIESDEVPTNAFSGIILRLLERWSVFSDEKPERLSNSKTLSGKVIVEVVVFAATSENASATTFSPVMVSGISKFGIVTIKLRRTPSFFPLESKCS